MDVALGLTVLASVVCAAVTRHGWRHRVHHLVPAPAMALGMGHLGVAPGPLAVLLGAGALWLCGLHLGRRARVGDRALGADAIDCAAMAVALVSSALRRTAAAVPTDEVQAVAALASQHAAHAAALPALGGAEGWASGFALVLGAVVFSGRLLFAGRWTDGAEPVRRHGLATALPRTTSVGAGALMAVATASMLLL